MLSVHYILWDRVQNKLSVYSQRLLKGKVGNIRMCLVMNQNKKKILYRIIENFEGKVSDFFIIGSFFKDEWNPEKSDIDIVCIDASFEEYSYLENKKYIKTLLYTLPYNFDIFIYTPKQFEDKIKHDLKFYKQISEGVSL